MTDPRRWITAEEAPTVLGISKWTVRSWAKREQLYSRGLDPHRRPLYRITDLEALRDRKPRRGPRVHLTSGNT